MNSSVHRPLVGSPDRQTTTVSDLFLELHHRIEQMEEAVAVARPAKNIAPADRPMAVAG